MATDDRIDMSADALIGEVSACVLRIKAHLGNLAFIAERIATDTIVPNQAVQLTVKVGEHIMRVPSDVLGENGIAPLFPAIQLAEQAELARHTASLYALASQLYSLFGHDDTEFDQPAGPAITPETLDAARPDRAAAPPRG